MIVIDSSILASFILKEPGWEKIKELMLDAVTVDLAIKEVFNALLIACQTGRITFEDAQKKAEALEKLITINVKTFNQEDILMESFELAYKEKLTIYDSLFIVLARKLKLPLATKDRRQHEVALLAGVPASLY
ncbi:MAG: type II toxin-antitoxin system VapC family toxin [Candidatus Caldarchaeum sp.]|uniref:PIN domain-containing protein n=1 Tax=Caldiarchaeum subterraneum TaxID=311458 RepID=A0A7C4E0L8_CALS0|nr:type II toxin-antitoxin system VapC family toxin [Candidatus Caldarchaeales archaeon]MDJ0271974.1 type II toxin-antitoxin system VapC family toxin [Candidatus Caldarchaeales archaeon]